MDVSTPSTAKRTTDQAHAALKGLYVRTGSTGQRRWIVKAKRRGYGQVCTVTLGSLDVISEKTAIAKAKEVLRTLAEGIDPNEQRRQAALAEARHKNLEAARRKTLRECLHEYLAAKQLKERTRKDLERSITRLLADWLDRPVREISRSDVQERYGVIESSAAPRQGTVNPTGAAQAKKVFAYLSAILNFVGSDDVGGEPLLKSNPANVLRDKRMRRALKPRERYLTGDERRAVLDELSYVGHPEYRGPVTRSDASLVALLLFTGLRIKEALELRWTDISFADELITVRNTKNDVTHRLPMTKTVRGVLKAQRSITGQSPCVFPSPVNPSSPMTAERTFERLSRASGVTCTAHDLRRTVASVCAEIGVDLDTIGRVLNHSPARSVTARYVQTSAHRIRSVLEDLELALTEDYKADPGP